MNQNVILWKPSEREHLERFFREIKSHNHHIAAEGHCFKCKKLQKLCCKQLCVIQGHSGSGKKTTLQLIANQLAIELLEYNSIGNYNENVANKTQVFLNFLSEVRKKRRLTISKNTSTKATVIYDIPSTIELKFVESLKEELHYLTTSLNGLVSPFIILVNDSSRDTIFLNKIFEDFTSSPSIAYIKITNINKSKIKKLLTDWLDTRYGSTKIVRNLTQLTNYLSDIAKGDIRFAISMLQFYSISNFNNYLPLGKDVLLTPFHTLGKILYNKRYPLVKWSTVQCNHQTGRYINFLTKNTIKPPFAPNRSIRPNKMDIDQYWDILELDISSNTVTPIDINASDIDADNNINININEAYSKFEYNQRATTLDNINTGLCKLDWCKLPLGVKLDGLGKSDEFQHIGPYSIPEGVGEPKQLNPNYLTPKCNRPCSYFVPEEVIAMSGCDDDYFTESLRQEFINFYCEIYDIARAESHFAFVDTIREAGSRLNYSLLANINLPAVAARGVLDYNLKPTDPKSNNGSLYQFKSLECVTNERKYRKIIEIAQSKGMNVSQSTFKHLLPFKYMMKHNIIRQLSSMYDGWCK
ncbi:hypothetical protein BMR1_03g00841 [Babesia microti strain RI]|uniref:Uncharacterized protein n=1 Tax=Babesia microti (strain RI) TaxID=1133968 RepID=A0A1R4AB94_BABMR|nr:hypothetical protein BMR1_03g00841 [Babesia microti strain RI]SJK86283.1 hypothetical protein BMR1_03g00841 [Babesia microti strain RI]|eukprot:XP_012648779.2 hypothetical protein BMR1_03g00841 [Babesia microti strain RI]